MSPKPTPTTGETLREVGEFGLIDRIAARFGALAGVERESSGGVDPGEGRGWLGIGDDCTVLPLAMIGEGATGALPEKPTTPAEVLLATTDLLVEGSHFRLEWTTPEDLGYKALAVNLSDVAAMGGSALVLSNPRIATANTHGTGCTYSSAIAAGRARGLPLTDAVREANAYLHRAIEQASLWRVGGGHGPVHHFHPFFPIAGRDR